MEDSQRELTAGEVAVGLNFNPSNSGTVEQVEQAFAVIFDIVEQSVSADDGTLETARRRKMRDSALHEIITAQMWAVKVITLGFGDNKLKASEAVASKPAAASAAVHLSGQHPLDEAKAEIEQSNDNPDEQGAAVEREIPTDGRVVRTSTSGDRVYYLNETKKTRQWVTNPDVLDSLHFIMEDVTEVEEDELLKYQMGPALYKRVDEA